ncbi:hypothetical protein CAPTEDRAFT_226671 [Capitella teleta]|uniref:Uncharacterized protein n=1 Tax=Capitella teleta TaxID=283909 RepID=R7VDP6_CAPTE|nr:hypothetical protein CAPTEDRAFT_226671 [Capitella teleta]|eukprot:ELU16973.1 hypothetical protein CAPTEDRAFT_226671 [Capitella teleta]
MAEGGRPPPSPHVTRKRVYRVQYKQPGQQSTGKKPSMNVYDRSKDGNIFELGNAFQGGDFDIDSFLNQMSGDGVVTQDGDGKTTYTADLKGDANVPMIDIDGDGIPDVPAVRTKRIITITRGDGTQQKQVIEGIPGQLPDPTAMFEGAEVVGDDFKPLVDDEPNNDGGSDYVAKTNRLVRPQIKIDDPSRSTEDLQPQKPTKNNAPSVPEFAPKIPDDDSPTDDDIMANRRKSISPAAYFSTRMSDDENLSSSDDEIQTRWHSSLCPGRRRRLSRRLKLDTEKKDVKQGMTASEVAAPGDEAKLPAIQMMIMNYNRMLEENMEEFRETLFRAVKLNGVDVVKILLRLVQRKKISLASESMREPESSATILHVALLLNLEAMVKYLIQFGDKDLIMATYTKDDYHNQTTLHVAVANGNLNIIELLLTSLNREERKKLLNTVANGTYFRYEHPEGQLCVSAAAWSRNSRTLITLAKYGASFATANLNGDTLLHSIIRSSVDQPKLQDYPKLINRVFEAVGEWAKHCRYKTRIAVQRSLEEGHKQVSIFHKLLNLQNNDGATPLNLAAQLSSPLMLTLINMEKIYKIPQTKLGSVAWVTYDVTDLTTFALGSYNKFSALHCLAHNSKLGHSGEGQSTLDKEPIKSLLTKKWSVYRWIYTGWFFIHLLYMSILTGVANSAAPPWKNQTVEYVIHHDGGEHVAPNKALVLFALLPLGYLILECLDLFGTYPYSIQFMYGQSVLAKLKVRAQSEILIIGNGPYRAVLVGHSLMVMLWLYLYLTENTSQLRALSMAMLLGWIFLLFFTRGCPATSRFSVMIQKMFFRDLMYFFIIFGLIMIAFTMAINVMYSNIRNVMGIGANNLLYQMLNVVINLEDKGDLPMTSFPNFTMLLVVIYTIMAVVLMLNMLIAMMNTSYETVRCSNENMWRHQQLSIMLMLERRLFWCRPLCLLSEGNVWYKDFNQSTRAFIDVTTTQS